MQLLVHNNLCTFTNAYQNYISYSRCRKHTKNWSSTNIPCYVNSTRKELQKFWKVKKSIYCIILVIRMVYYLIKIWTLINTKTTSGMKTSINYLFFMALCRSNYSDFQNHFTLHKAGIKFIVNYWSAKYVKNIPNNFLKFGNNKTLMKAKLPHHELCALLTKLLSLNRFTVWQYKSIY